MTETTRGLSGRKSKNDKDEIFKMLAVILITAFVSSMSTFTFSYFVGVTEPEVRRIVKELISTDAPYIADRQVLQKSIMVNNEQIKEIKSSIDALRSDSKSLNVQLAKIESKLDLVLNK